MFTLNNIRFKNILDIEALTIPKHKVTCIVGESGSGKTTLLRLLNKLISYDSGEIFYNGQALTTIPSVELRRRVTMLSQLPSIFPGTIGDNLKIGLKFSEKPVVSDAKIRDILRMVHLNKEPDTESDKLSGGEKQRLALGRIILLDPEVFYWMSPPLHLMKKPNELSLNN